ncbi:bifunctional diguanylate cyclase/phosphodiesterase [Elioraea sp.]|uniref:putative bifunctional diguanylate cyclase/phosphodiesterase n=1 Tax=Elioraea sp. TaxID=2185103 RepID=UPI0025BF6153|nr:GGDEF and EAL domain-containing protein [Elioraea sp.]
MAAAPLPPDEPDRIAAVHALRLLDTPAEERFNAFTRLARSIAETPVALFSMIDTDRQWFKAREGIGFSETPRQHAFCAHAILSPGEVLVVEDARRDQRFADNPLVLGPVGIQSYAGAPVLAPSGHPVGTLCVIDKVPRHFSGALADRLADLALGVSQMLSLHTALRHLHGLVSHDPLTGLLNHHGFDEVLAGLDASRDTALLMALDLDGFKQINDLLGHVAGDAALAAVADRLRRAAAPGATIARLGGDNFSLLLPRATRAAAAARRLLTALTAPIIVEGHLLRVSASIGTARFPADGASPAALQRAADAALYAAKSTGRGGFAQAVRLTPGAGSPLGRFSIATELREALLGPTPPPFALAWQPIIDARTGLPRSYEALIRWPRPDGMTLMPGQFIPIAEKTGLIAHLDRWVLRTATAEAARAAPGLRIAINLSPPNLLLADLPDVVETALATSGLSPKRLVLEMTESILVQDPKAVLEAFTRLRSLGISIALDDFGEGASSFMYLRDLPFDKVKIDRRFVHAAASDQRAATVLDGIMKVVRALGAVSVAEGVETEAQAALLRQLGVDAMQGWLFGKPGALPGLTQARDAA